MFLFNAIYLNILDTFIFLQVWCCVALSVIAGVASLYGISRLISRIKRKQKENNKNRITNQTTSSNLNEGIGFSRALCFYLGLLLGKGVDLYKIGKLMTQ